MSGTFEGRNSLNHRYRRLVPGALVCRIHSTLNRPGCSNVGVVVRREEWPEDGREVKDIAEDHMMRILKVGVLWIDRTFEEVQLGDVVVSLTPSGERVY